MLDLIRTLANQLNIANNNLHAHINAKTDVEADTNRSDLTILARTLLVALSHTERLLRQAVPRDFWRRCF